MSLTRRTVSEVLFEELCRVYNISFRQLPTIEGVRQPDFEMILQSNTVVAEIKQIDLNSEDKAFHLSLEKLGRAQQNRNPNDMARRIRNHIDESREQFQTYLARNPSCPSVLVVFDAARNGYTDPYTIQTALHGWEQVSLQNADQGAPPMVVARGFGRRNDKALRPDKNQHLSALATLHECFQLNAPRTRFLTMCFYHNPYATYPLPTTWFSDLPFEHLQLTSETGGFQNWTPVPRSSENG